MEIYPMDSTPNEAKLSIKDGDIGVLYIIQHELLKLQNIKFAGVITRHPLTNEIWMRVNSTNPLKDISKATNTAIESIDEIKKAFTSKLK